MKNSNMLSSSDVASSNVQRHLYIDESSVKSKFAQAIPEIELYAKNASSSAKMLTQVLESSLICKEIVEQDQEFDIDV